MHFPTLSLLSLLAATPALSATTPVIHNVGVGESGLSFTPKTLTAKVGDMIHFHFYSGDHSVAQSLFTKPCAPSGPKAIYSGFQNPSGSAEEAKLMFSMRVNSTEPIWLYCSAPEHCQNGMSMVVNPPKASTGNTIAAYQKASSSASGSSPAKVFGGVLVPNKRLASSPSAIVSSTMTTDSAAASATASASAGTGSGGNYGGSTGAAAGSRISIGLVGAVVAVAGGALLVGV